MDEIKGVYVIDLRVYQSNGVDFRSDALERIYFPWTIDPSYVDINFESSKKRVYLISAGLEFIRTDKYEYCLVVPLLGYNKLNEFEKCDALPSNIAYMFNHAGNPNGGYFFVDLIEESGTLTKPPYDPRREGYNFLGWYKDEACTEEWDFENDTVEIAYDEEGNRIYEEIKIYAGWEEQSDYGADLTHSYNVAFMLNYEDAPNDGYYYIEEQNKDGTIKEPTVEPVRIGYLFHGWYKDEACTEEWNFETDEVTISFDEEGNRIHEEIKLYAKWYKRW